MEHIIARLLVSDNAVIQQATHDLKREFRTPSAAIGDLCTVVITSNNSKIRQYAAVLLRQRLTKLKNWNKLDVELKARFMQELHPVLLSENEQPVVKVISQLIGTIAKHVLATDNKRNWEEFIISLCRLKPGEDHSQKAQSYFIVRVLSEDCPDVLASVLHTIGALVVDVVKSQIDVKNPGFWHCLSIIKNVATRFPEDLFIRTSYSLILPHMLQTVKIFAESRDLMSCDLLEMLDDMVANSVITKFEQVFMILQTCLDVINSQFKDDDLIIKALTVVDTIIKTNKKIILIYNYMGEVLAATVQVMQTSSEELDYDTSNQFNCPVMQASQVLDALFLNFSPRKIMPDIVQIVQELGFAKSPPKRKACLLVMAVSAEGCAEFIRSGFVSMYSQLLCEGLEDSDPLVRNAALYALGQLSEHLQPDFSKNADKVMPILFRLLEDVTVNLKDLEGKIPVDRIFYALETFTEHLGKYEILPYLPSMIPSLVSLVKTEESSTHLKQLAFSAIAACASSSEENITPYLPQIVECLSAYLVKGVPVELSCLQVQAIETMATLARSVPPEEFQQVAHNCVQFGYMMLENECDPEVEGSIYGLFGAISLVLKENMTDVMGPIITTLIKTIESNEGFVIQFDEDELAGGFPSCGDFSEDSCEEIDLEADEDEDDDDSDEVTGYGFENVYVDKKIEACSAIKELAANTGAAFFPYLQLCYSPILKLLEFPNDGIKKAAIDALAHICISWSASVAAGEESSAFNNNISILFQKCAEIVHTSDEREVVIHALDAYGDFLKLSKNFKLKETSHREAIFNCVLDVFHKKIFCQLEEEDEDNEPPTFDEEKIEKDQALIEYAGDIVQHFGKAMTCDEFRPYFASFYPSVKEMLVRSHSFSVQSFCIGVLAECMEPLGPAVDDYANDILHIFTAGVQIEDSDVRNNAVFGLGEIILHGKEIFFEHYNDVLQLLSECLSQETEPKVIDNICGAVARMILANSGLVPIPEVFPVVMSCLPLRKDFKENYIILKLFLTLYECGHDIIALNLEKILKIIIHIIHHKQGEKDSLDLAEHIFCCIRRDFPGLVRNLSVPDEMMQTYSILLNK